MNNVSIKIPYSAEEALLLDLSTLNCSLRKGGREIDRDKLRSILARAIPCREDKDIQYNMIILAKYCRRLSFHGAAQLVERTIKPILNVVIIREGQARLYMQLTKRKDAYNASKFIYNVAKSPASVEELSIDISFTHLNIHIQYELYHNIIDLLSAVPELNKLKKFSFKVDKIHLYPIFWILKTLRRATSLEILDLKSNRLGASSILVSTLARSIQKLKKLKVLNLGGNLIGSKGAKKISAALKNLPVLEQLDLSNNFLGFEALGAVKESISELRKFNLSRWDFTDCSLSPEVAADLTTTLGSLVTPF